MPRVGIKQKLDEDKDDSQRQAGEKREEKGERRMENGNDNAIMDMNIN